MGTSAVYRSVEKHLALSLKEDKAKRKKTTVTPILFVQDARAILTRTLEK
jgi:hypothetical protein